MSSCDMPRVVNLKGKRFRSKTIVIREHTGTDPRVGTLMDALFDVLLERGLGLDCATLVGCLDMTKDRIRQYIKGDPDA